MHDASRLVLPGSAVPWRRPAKGRRGSLRLSPEELDVTSRAELLARGYTDHGLRTAVRGGRLRRIAPGWFAGAAAQPKVTRPLAAGHRLTCISATRMHGVWTPYGDSSWNQGNDESHEQDGDPDPGRLHVYRYQGDRAAPDSMATHPSRSRTWPEPDAVASLHVALDHAIRCQDGETAAVLLESAMERRLLDPAEVQHMLDRAPAALRSRIGILSTASDSGSETRVVRWLRRRGFRVEQQVFVEDVGYIDAYVGGLFLEIDGREPHEMPDAFSRDRRRDLRTTRHGLQVMRLSYEQTWITWEDTKTAVLETIAEVGAFGRKKAARLEAR